MGVLILLPENFLPGPDSLLPSSWALTNGSTYQMLSALTATFLEKGIPHRFFSGTDLGKPARAIQTGEVRGLISLYRGQEDATTETLKRLMEQVPSVSLMTGWRQAGIPYVGLDNGRAVSLLLQHLVAEGHRRIAFFGPHFHPSLTLEERLHAWRTGLRERGLPVPKHYALATLDPREWGPTTSLRFENAMTTWWDRLDPRPDAVLCYSDALALMLEQHVASKGLTVPRDLALTGINGHFLDHPRLRHLTTVINHFSLAARTAAHLLLDLMKGPWPIAGNGAPQIRLGAELVIGDSSRRRTALPRERDREFLAGVLAFTREHLHEPDLATRIAERSEISRSHFRLKFATLQGMPFHQYVNQERLSRVATSLEHDPAPIADLASLYGFHNMSGFNRLFKRRFGMTPRAWRAKAMAARSSRTPSAGRRSSGSST